MIKANVHIEGDNNKEIRRFISALAYGIDAEIKVDGTAPKHGRDYRRSGGRTHTASAPGESPAVDTGLLYNSIQVNIKSDTEAQIIVPAEYAEILEFGSGNIAERPFVRPAIDSVLKRFDSGGFLGGVGE